MNESEHAAALVTLVDAVLISGDLTTTGGCVGIRDLASLVTDLIPLPAASLTVDQALDFAADRIVNGAVVAVEVAKALLDRLCAATGESGAAVLREISAVLMEVPE